MIGFAQWKSNSTSRSATTSRRCCTRQDSFREKLSTGGRHLSMDVPIMLLLSPSRNLERISDPTTYPKDYRAEAGGIRSIEAGPMSVAEYHDKFA